MDYYENRDSVCDFNNESINTVKTNSEIQRFFAGKSVFITGATGLLGTLVMEHLLRCCPRIEKIYVLLRPKKNKSAEERLNTLIKSEVFWKVRRIHKDPMKKIHIITGDISLPNCGISESDRKLIIDNVNIIYHSAAGLRMDEKLNVAYDMNVRPVEDLLKIGLEMKQLKAFIHVSTAYSITFKTFEEVKETLAETTYSADEIKFLIDNLKETDLAALTPKILGEWANTYAFTKAMGENVCKKYRDRLPVVVARPSIVVGCATEPLVSWINNFYGATGVSMAASLGLMRVWQGANDKIADVIPADKVVTTMVAMAWQTGTYHSKGKIIEPPVYNIVSSNQAPMTWRDYMNGTEHYANTDKVVAKRFLRDYQFYIEDSHFIYCIKAIIYHLCFGLLVDFILQFKGKPPMLTRGFVKIYNFNSTLRYYSGAEWAFEQENMARMWSEMSSLDRKIFNYDMTNFDWEKYHSHTIRSICSYLLQDDLSDIENNRLQYYKIFKIMEFVKYSFHGVVLYFFRDYFRYPIMFLHLVNV